MTFTRSQQSGEEDVSLDSQATKSKSDVFQNESLTEQKDTTITTQAKENKTEFSSAQIGESQKELSARLSSMSNHR